jgi:hypothetical protein
MSFFEDDNNDYQEEAGEWIVMRLGPNDTIRFKRDTCKVCQHHSLEPTACLYCRATNLVSICRGCHNVVFKTHMGVPQRQCCSQECVTNALTETVTVDQRVSQFFFSSPSSHIFCLDVFHSYEPTRCHW